ncbi:fasciclin domain-containing protein [Sphingobacterium tabacisoli]|uniref:Fasciclin domain-containing protein n=1 Tax=Sphingobacterium tabacisoli TaxID=2044855 RepID=A0ABW5L5H4_9SPHI|nr:fasciclin domain-containing protein [Sphingobacterium tabacisoli]
MRKYLIKKQKYTLLLIGLLAVSCEKKEEVGTTFDNNRINMVIADNFNLANLNAVLRVSGLDKELQKENGPFTILAPSDAAFAIAGYSKPEHILAERASVISNIGKYHTMDGFYELNKLPFLFNQELSTRGGKVFATHWVKGADTVLTLNGSRVVANNIPSSNGLIQVLDRVLTPYQHDKIADAITADVNITLFAQAIQRSGLKEQLDGEGPYTVFAPNNDAMAELGYKTVQQIENADVTELRKVVNYHILRDRRFIYDYILSAGPSNIAKQAMLDGNSMTVKLVPNPNSLGSFNGIVLRGIGNSKDINVVKQDILTGNGVLHIINETLRITQ